MSEDWKRDELFLLFSRRTNRKDKENYILNAVWHKLNNTDLQPVTQQCVVLKDGKRALIDLFFPQLQYGIECDEAYHKNQTFEDLDRAERIEQALSSVNQSQIFLKRIDATKTLEEINKDIDDTVKEINARIKALNKPLLWKSVDERINDVIEKGILSVSDLIPFPKEASTGPCFNRFPKIWQKSYFALNDDYQIWFPKLALDNSGDTKPLSSAGWKNTLSDEWTTITEYNEDYAVEEEKKQNKKRVVFAHSKDVYGRKAYYFIGVFIYIGTDASGKRLYKKIEDHIDLGQFRNN